MDYPAFDEALSRFHTFLRNQGQCGEIRWIFSSDTVLVRGQWFLWPRPQALAVAEVAVLYQAAVERRLGVMFSVLCQEGIVLWCYLFCPADRTEAESSLMPDGLKLSIPTKLRPGQTILDRRKWYLLQRRDEVEFKTWIFR